MKVAVVGMACVFPGAPDVAAFWRNVRDGVDSITAVPPDRWGGDFGDQFRVARGGFVGEDALDLDCATFGIMPSSVDGAEPDQLLALRTAALALADAGMIGVVGGRVGVILGRGGYLTPGLARLDTRLRVEHHLLQALRDLLPDLDAAVLAEVRQAFHRQLGPPSPDAAIGLVPNLAASRVANRLDLHGPAYTVDAACASSLVAIDAACAELRSGRCEVVIAGGVHHCHDVTLWSVFSQLGALSRSGTIRPYSRDADGIVVGEGTGMVVLEPLERAQRRGQPVYAVVAGTGIASDGRDASLMSPRVDGQVLALRQAYDAARLDPVTVGLVEGHGTATASGDRAELDTLRTVFGDTPLALGSVKSNIGHAMPAAGIAGLIKAVLAVHHGVRPPTLHAEVPHPAAAAAGFRLLAEAEPWSANGSPRRAGVNAFGFGGINAHVVVESVLARGTPRRPRVPDARTAIVEPTPRKHDIARRAVERGRAWRGTNDVWHSPAGLLAGGGKVAFLCPGLEPTFHVEVDDVAAALGVAPPRPPAGCTPLEAQGRQIFAAGRLLARALAARGVVPDHVAGHSLGEWTGMFVSGMVPADGAGAFLDGLQPGRLEVPDVVYLALGCGAGRAATLLDGLEDVTVSHDNCPHQAVVCGRLDAVERAAKRCADAGVTTRSLPFRSGFHSPAFAGFLPPLREAWDRMPLGPPEVPLWSATTAERYPAEPDAVRELCADHLVRPVRFRELVERLYDEAGVRVFVQLGTGSLTNFVDDTLKGRPHLTVTAHDARRSALAQLDRVAAALWAEGSDTATLGPTTTTDQPRPTPNPRTTVRLSLDSPKVVLPPLLAAHGGNGAGGGAAWAARVAGRVASRDGDEEAAAGVRGAARGVVAAAHGRLVAETLAASDAVATALATRRREVRRPLRVSLETHPWLTDHRLFRQREDWADGADGFPIVPITTMLDWLGEAARTTGPGEVTAVEDLRAQRWLTAAPATSSVIRATPEGPDTVRASIDGHATARVRLCPHGPAAGPAPTLEPLTNLRPAPLDAVELYAGHWMFHGPAFQGVRELTAIGDDGIDGVVEALPTPGAFLDCAGQLFGYWLMATAEANFLALPLSIERVDHLGPPVPVGERAEVRVRITGLTERTIRADLEVIHRGRVAVRIRGWEDRRFDSDPALWHMLRHAEHDTLATGGPGGVVVLDERWTDSSSRDLIARRYLTASELRSYGRLNLRDQRRWLLARIAAKDAVRRTLWAAGHGDLFPAEVTLAEPVGSLLVDGPLGRNLRLSVAVADGVAVARASLAHEVGVHVAPAGEGARERAAEEAARQATSLAVRLDGGRRREARRVDGDGRVLVGDRWVETAVLRAPLQGLHETTNRKEYVIAWTDDS